MIDLSNTLNILKGILFLFSFISVPVFCSQSHDEARAEIRALLSPLVNEQLLLLLCGSL